jgi:hypothetical protein
MIQRHRHQYRALLDEMNRTIKLERGQLKVKQAQLKGETDIEQAMTPVRTINRIFDSELSTIEKTSLVISLSPSRLNENRSPAPKLPRSLMP